HSSSICSVPLHDLHSFPTRRSSDLLGVEVAGIVEKTVPGSGIEEGTRIMGLVNGGGYAEYAVMPVDRAMPIPDNLSFVEAAAIPDRKSTRLNSSHVSISYAVFCLKK